MTIKGIEFIAAVTLAAKLGDLSRFADPKELMSYRGVVPGCVLEWAVAYTGSDYQDR